MPAPVITTKRLVLSQLRPEDSEALFAYRSLPEVSRYQTWKPERQEEADTWVGELADAEFDTPGTWFQFGIRLRESDALVGDLGVHSLGDGDQVELGVTLDPTHQRTGLATEALLAVIQYLFDRLGKHRVIASVDPRNETSAKLMERVGLRQETDLCDSGADDLVFVALRSEWPSTPAD